MTPAMSKAMRFRASELRSNWENEETPWVRVEDLGRIDLPRPVGIVNGAFDLLHSSHMRLIFRAKHCARTLICALDGDEFVRRQKGDGRPVMNWIERATTLGYMPIDYIVEIGGDEEFKELLRVVKPDFRAQGHEYEGRASRFKIPKLFIRDGVIHTSKIISRILEGAKTHETG